MVKLKEFQKCYMKNRTVISGRDICAYAFILIKSIYTYTLVELFFQVPLRKVSVGIQLLDGHLIGSPKLYIAFFGDHTAGHGFP